MGTAAQAAVGARPSSKHSASHALTIRFFISHPHLPWGAGAASLRRTGRSWPGQRLGDALDRSYLYRYILPCSPVNKSRGKMKKMEKLFSMPDYCLFPMDMVCFLKNWRANCPIQPKKQKE